MENYKKCKNCGFEYEKSLSRCPNCNHNPMFDSDKVITFFCVVFILIFVFNIKSFEKIGPGFIKNIESYEIKNKKEEAKEIPISIKLREISELSGLSKKEIFEQRKKYVKNSVVFANLENYEPNLDVYQIEDNLPWISAEEITKNGTKGNLNIGKGPSRNSISVNNPELLITFLAPQFQLKDYSTYNYFHPYKAQYYKEKNLIEVYFNMSEFYKHNKNYFGLKMYPDETNARDLGYSWMYAKNLENIYFQSKTLNFSTKPYRMRGYYHKGFSCGLKEGCNNYSPYQEQIIFSIIDTPAFMEVEFYKDEPKPYRKKPDITYRMIFD